MRARIEKVDVNPSRWRVSLRVEYSGQIFDWAYSDTFQGAIRVMQQMRRKYLRPIEA